MMMRSKFDPSRGTVYWKVSNRPYKIRGTEIQITPSHSDLLLEKKYLARNFWDNRGRKASEERGLELLWRSLVNISGFSWQFTSCRGLGNAIGEFHSWSRCYFDDFRVWIMLSKFAFSHHNRFIKAK